MLKSCATVALVPFGKKDFLDLNNTGTCLIQELQRICMMHTQLHQRVAWILCVYVCVGVSEPGRVAPKLF